MRMRVMSTRHHLPHRHHANEITLLMLMLLMIFYFNGAVTNRFLGWEREKKELGPEVPCAHSQSGEGCRQIAPPASLKREGGAPRGIPRRSTHMDKSLFKNGFENG